MAGFLSGLSRVVVPFGEVGGQYLSQTGAAQDAEAKKARSAAALSAFVTDPTPEGLSAAIQAGVSPDYAVKALNDSKVDQARKTIAQRLAESGGKVTPEIMGLAVTNRIDPKALTFKDSSADHSADVAYLDSLIAAEPDPAKKAQLTAMRPAVEAEGSIVFQRLGLKGVNAPPKELPMHLIPHESPTGEQEVIPYQQDPKTGKLIKVPFADASGTTPEGGITGKLAAMEQRSLNAVKEIEFQLPRATQMMTQLGATATPTKQFQEWNKYRFPYGGFGKPDPAWANYFQLVGSMKSSIASAQLAGSGSRSIQMVNYIKAHIPDEEDPPDRALKKLQGFDAGRFAAIKASLLGTNGADTTATVSDFTPIKPPFDYGGEMRKTADGNYLVRDRKGLTYKYDPVRGAWLPL